MEKPWGKLEDMGAVGGDMVIDADNLIKYSSAQAFSQVHENTFSSCFHKWGSSTHSAPPMESFHLQ